MSICNPKQGQNKAIVVAGPTASGKSQLAIELAEKANGVIINADSMQVYRDVPTLTARPSPADESRAEHRLYGFLEPYELCSAIKWARLAAEEMKRAWADGKVPVLTGGTGLYIQTLCRGISPVPEVSFDVRQTVRRRFEKMGREAFIDDLRRRDPSFSFTDPQRLMRAAEVLEQTGKSITEWQKQPLEKVIEADWFSILINPPREILYERCNARFDDMMHSGAVEEVRILLAKNPPADSLVLKAIGVAEITAFLNGTAGAQEAAARARQMTRNYAKRQVTWFTRRFDADSVICNAKNAEILTKALHFLQ